jgi:gliding motility-associated-like protein
MCKKILILSILLIQIHNAYSQSGTWIWLGGDSVRGSQGNFGIKGVSSPNNMPPCSYESNYWTEKNGNLWMLGGVTDNNYSSNSLWKYDINNQQWTWMNGPQASNSIVSVNYGTLGIPSPLNYPPPSTFGSNCWTDSLGDFWLYGGNALDCFWKYHVATNEWTWMGGHMSNLVSFIEYNPTYGPKGVEDVSYYPGTRAECKSGWVHNNKLYLFGGLNSYYKYKNDLWYYNISNNKWAWEAGLTDTNSAGNFGLKGVATTNNLPPAKINYSRWFDNENFYLFGGADFDSVWTKYLRNDLWKYNLQTKLWTWISGTNTRNEAGSSNNFCEEDTNFIPMSRIENSSISVRNKCYQTNWTFGGYNYQNGYHNDLWVFNTQSLGWTKIKGEAGFSLNQPYQYGIKGIPDINNLPPARCGSAIWSNAMGELYIFGGGRFDNIPTTFNDFWKFIPDTTCYHKEIVSNQLPPITDSMICKGDTIHYVYPPLVSITVNPQQGTFIDTLNRTIHFFNNTTTTYTITAKSLLGNSDCFPNDTLKCTISLFANPIAAFTINPTTTTLAQPTFNAINQSQHAVKYEWYEGSNFISNAIDISKSYHQTGEYCFTLIAENTCGIKDTVTHCAKIIDEGDVFMPNAFSPNGDQLNESIFPIIRGDIKLNLFHIYNRWGQLLYQDQTNQKGWNGTYKGSPCEMGTYFYYIKATDALGKEKIYKGDITLLR